jgi:dienelactone hydrolase
MTIITASPMPSQAQMMRIEVHAFASETLMDEAFLRGDNGRAVTLAGALRLPLRGDEPLPAVVLLHGSGGISDHLTGWSDQLNDLGLATFLVDSFTGRGLDATLNDQSQLGRLAMIVDAYRALELLAGHPLIDADRIALIGFSRGGQAALYAASHRFRRLHGPPGSLEFSAYVAFYPLCNTTYHDDLDVSDRPIWIFHGSADDFSPVAYCRDYADRLVAAGKDVVLEEYPGAHHAFDWPLLAEPLVLEQAQAMPTCRLEERADGKLYLADTGQPFDYGVSCVGRGFTVAYDAAASAQARQAVRTLLSTLAAD